MVNVLEQLVDAIYETNRFSFADFIAVLSLVASWITIFFLIRENYAQKRPYVQVSFELIRSNLACVVIRNVGTVPVSLCKIEFDKNFIEQLPDSDEKRLFENGIGNEIYWNREGTEGYYGKRKRRWGRRSICRNQQPHILGSDPIKTFQGMLG